MTAVAPKFDFSLLRELRKKQGLTLDDVSVQSGVSVGVISKLERNQTVAELDTLYKLSRTFGMSTTDLLSLAETHFAHQVAEDLHRSGKFQFRQIRYANLAALLGEGEKGATTSRPEIHSDDSEICWVLEGKLRLSLPHETYKMGSGESIQFDAILEHTYEALEAVKILILHLRKEKRY